jgi:hypothetical protein
MTSEPEQGEHASWEACFYINVPVGVIALARKGHAPPEIHAAVH